MVMLMLMLMLRKEMRFTLGSGRPLANQAHLPCCGLPVCVKLFSSCTGFFHFFYLPMARCGRLLGEEWGETWVHIHSWILGSDVDLYRMIALCPASTQAPQSTYNALTCISLNCRACYDALDMFVIVACRMISIFERTK